MRGLFGQRNQPRKLEIIQEIPPEKPIASCSEENKHIHQGESPFGSRRTEIAGPKSRMDDSSYSQFKDTVFKNVLSSPDLKMLQETGKEQKLKEFLLKEIRIVIPYAGKEIEDRLMTEIINEICGYGPLEPLLHDDDVKEIMCVGPNKVWVEKHGEVRKVKGVRFDSEAHLKNIVDRIIQPLGQKVDVANPVCDGYLPEGHRLHVTIWPVATNGTELTIRKHPKFKMRPEDFVQNESITDAALTFLRACVDGRLNIVISGGTGSGKTTILNMISNFIETDRIIVCEDTRELDLAVDHTLYWATRKIRASKGDIVNIDMAALIWSALRARPDRIIVGECRSSEALEMLQAMNTGHDGSLTTLHANTPADALTRIEYMCTLDKIIPLSSLRMQISSAINMIIQINRDDRNGGKRRIVEIAEMVGLDDKGNYEVQPIFKMKYPLKKGESDTLGFTGYIPTFADRLTLTPDWYKSQPVHPRANEFLER